MDELQKNSWASRVAVFFATCGGVGFAPAAPGTLGALLGIPLAFGLASLPVGLNVITACALFLIGIPICDLAARALGKEDPGEVIWDEFATIPVTFLFVPLSSLQLPWVVIAGFLLHRFFDIRKIEPARMMERLHGGMGIMLDDLVAGAYSCFCLHGLIWTVAKFGS